jgi:hypothetical protein
MRVYLVCMCMHHVYSVCMYKSCISSVRVHLHTYIHTYTHTHARIHNIHTHGCIMRVATLKQHRIHTYIRWKNIAYTHTHTHIYIRIHTYTYIRLHHARCNVEKHPPFWSVLIRFDPFWSVLIRFDPFWSVLNLLYVQMMFFFQRCNARCNSVFNVTRSHANVMKRHTL